MRPDYCPIGNEPCQSLCDTPCSTQQRYTTDAMKVRQAVAQAVAQQEPVACVQDLDEVKRKHLVYEKGMDWKDPLYTTPPQRKPLTDEEINALDYSGTRIEFVRAIEAAHGIKGEA